MFLYGQSKFQALYKANAEQAKHLAALRSLLKIGELPKPATVPKSDNHEDALRWLLEGRGRLIWMNSGRIIPVMRPRASQA